MIDEFLWLAGYATLTFVGLAWLFVTAAEWLAGRIKR
jgi:hypothetical protein